MNVFELDGTLFCKQYGLTEEEITMIVRALLQKIVNSQIAVPTTLFVEMVHEMCQQLKDDRRRAVDVN